MQEPLYLNDLSVGQRFTSGTHLLDADHIKRFAAEYDPQPFHLDESAAADTFFHGLAASGWQVVAVTMMLLVQGGFRSPTASLAPEPNWHGPSRHAPATPCRRPARSSTSGRRH